MALVIAILVFLVLRSRSLAVLYLEQQKVRRDRTQGKKREAVSDPFQFHTWI